MTFVQLPLGILIYFMWTINIWLGTKIDEMFVFSKVLLFSIVHTASAAISIYCSIIAWNELSDKKFQNI